MSSVATGGTMMAYFGSKTEAQRPCAAVRRAVRGVTFIELMVVVGLISILTVSLVAAYGRFQSGFRASSALTKVESALHYARNLAIANNRVYHVRFENVVNDSTTAATYGTTIGKPLGAPQAPRMPPQSLAIYCFPDIGTALGVTNEDQLLPTTGSPEPIKWNQRSGPTADWSEAVAYAPGASVLHNKLIFVCKDAVGPTANVPDTDAAHWTPYLNYVVERIDLPQDTYFGIQYPTGVAPAAASFPLVYFKPDGTMHFVPDNNGAQTLTMFVTDSVLFAEDRNGSIALQCEDRKYAYNFRKLPQGSAAHALPWIKMIHVYQGGMIRVRPLTTASGAPNPIP